MLYTNEGITERVRSDLTGPDGKPGIDISGYTMKNMYEEMSHGAYTVTGGDPVGQGRPLRGLVRRVRLPQERRGRVPGRRRRTCRATRTTRSARASSRSTQ